VVAALLVELTTACTGADHDLVDPAVAHACNVTMGFSRMTVEYLDCVESIEAVKVAAAEQARSEHDWQLCGQQGLQAGTPAYALCVLQLQREQTIVAQSSKAAK
jgi:hypothetical protein